MSQQVQQGTTKYPVTQPPVSLPCLYAIGSALDPSPKTRLGHTWESFIHHEFFRPLDFELLEKKRIEPIFIPSSEKTNFDATYDLEELLLEEAPLEARARRQKPRERLKEDATKQEIREDELYRMIDTDFRPFDYTVAAYKKYATTLTAFQAKANRSRLTGQENGAKRKKSVVAESDNGPRAITTDVATPAPRPETTSHSSNGSPKSRSGSDDIKYRRRGSPKQQTQQPTPPPQQQQQQQPPQPPQQRYQSEYVSRRHQTNGNRVTSPAGGVQVTLDGGGSWSELARQDATLPTDANTTPGVKPEVSSGVFGFLKNKKVRTHSPKPKERGVLGKEGARVVIS